MTDLSDLVSNTNLELEAARLSPANLAAYQLSKRVQDPTKQWQHNFHLDLINEALVMVASGDIRRLAVFMPPRYGKSELISINFPAWYLGNNPHNRVIIAANQHNLASDFGRQARDILTEVGPQLFGVTVSRRTSAVNDWAVQGHRGGLRAAGIGGGITGRGANVLIIDDPVKDQVEAFSQRIQERNWGWYETTALTRLEPNGSMIIVQTRWHENDLAGKILERAAEDGGSDVPFIIISLPAIAEENNEAPIRVVGNEEKLPGRVREWITYANNDSANLRKKGQVLWNERWPEEEVYKIKKEKTTYVWLAMFQQKPVPDSGLVFKLDWFQYVDSVPIDAYRVRGWDLAGSENRDSDYTAGVRISYSPTEEAYYIEDVVRAQWDAGEVKKNVKLVTDMDGYNTAIRMEQEPGASGKITIVDFAKTLRGYDFQGVRASGKKSLRWDRLAAAMQHGQVYLLRDPNWNKTFVSELIQLPASKNDDQADAACIAFAALNELDQNEVNISTL